MSCLLQGDVTLQTRILPSTEALLITLPGLHNTKKPVATSLNDAIYPDCGIVEWRLSS